jgi:chaperonin cofactor prefoldin
MLKTIGKALLLVLLTGVVAWGQAPAAPAAAAAPANDDKVAALQQERAKVADNIAAAKKLLEGNPGDRKAALEQQVERWTARLKEIDTELARLQGDAAPAATAGDQPVDEDTAKEIARINRQIRGLLNQIKELTAEIDRLPKDQPGAGGMAPGGQPMVPGGPAEAGMMQPGVPMQPGMQPPAMVPEPGSMQPGMTAMEGGAGAPMANTRRGQLVQRRAQVMQRLLDLRARLEELEGGPKDELLPEENIEALHPLDLYNGSVDKNAFGLSLGSWGSGTVEETEYGVIQSRSSLLVTTDGYYRGARLDFSKPPEIKRYFDTAPISYLVMDVYFFPKQQETAATGMPGEGGGGMLVPPGMEGPTAMEGMPGVVPPEMVQPGMMAPGGQRPGQPQGSRMPAGGGSMRPGMMQPGQPGQPGMMQPGMPNDPAMTAMPGMEGMMPEPGSMQPGMEGMMPGGGMSQPTATGQKQAPATTSLRVLLETDRGSIVAEDFYFDYTYEVYPGWTRVMIPVSSFVNPSERTPDTLKRLALFGDQSDQFYIAGVKFVSDEVPISPSIVGTDVIEDAVAGEELIVDAVVDAGLSVVDYDWDWGDGDSEQTTDPTASHIYVKAGEYTISLVCNDTDGHKEPGKTSIKVIVKPFAERPTQPAGMMQPGMMQPGMVPPGGSMMQPPPAPEAPMP